MSRADDQADDQTAFDAACAEYELAAWDRREGEAPRYADIPRTVPDHGAQPRRPRLTVVYTRDNLGSIHHYRPRNTSLFDNIERPPSEAETSAWLIHRALVGMARAEARKLAAIARTAAEIEEIIETKIMPLARWAAKDLRPTVQDRVLREFKDLVRELLKDEVAKHRIKRNWRN
jgi:hypothetical protein